MLFSILLIYIIIIFHWYVFNIADITITVGCILTIILELFFKGKESQNEIDK